MCEKQTVISLCMCMNIRKKKFFDMVDFTLLLLGSVHYWTNIFVNRYYNFTGLKAGTFELLSGSRKFLLKTSPNSNYSEIQWQQVKKLKMSSKLKRIISVPGVQAPYNSEMTVM
ncbi:hypothetical protein X975_19943, partial [Stegodyphus mimosarum]